MHTGIATNRPRAAIAGPGSATPLPAMSCITESATSAPIITTSPCAKLMSPRMP